VEAFDKLGQPITVGCYIAYGHALGRCAGLRIGRVLALTMNPVSVYWSMGPIPHSPHITVIGVDDDWEHRPAELCKRVGTLMYPNRTVVLDKDTLPTKHRKLLDEFTWKQPNA
jgi:hypothetical protein